jgi:hypothetical protein
MTFALIFGIQMLMKFKKKKKTAKAPVVSHDGLQLLLPCMMPATHNPTEKSR